MTCDNSRSTYLHFVAHEL